MHLLNEMQRQLCRARSRLRSGATRERIHDDLGEGGCSAVTKRGTKRGLIIVISASSSSLAAPLRSISCSDDLDCAAHRPCLLFWKTYSKKK